MPSTNMHLDAEYALIDTRIEGFKQEILKLRYRRNEMSPISRLPVELLSRIFLIARDTYPGVHRLYQFKTYGWVKVAQVCHRWRQVALGCGELWSILDVRYSEAIPVLIDRSNSFPLTIRVLRMDFDDPVLPGSEAALSYVLKHYSSNIKALFADGTSGSIGMSVIAPLLIDLSVPNLQRLVLQGRDCPNECQTDESLLSPQTFGGSAPNLRELRLYSINIPWTSPLLIGLTSLTIRNSSSSTSATPEEFFGALQQMPDLRSLLIEDLPDALEIFSGGISVRFPHLEWLCLCSSAETCLATLKALTIPVSATMSLILRCEDCEGEYHDDCDPEFIEELTDILRSAWLENPPSGAQLHTPESVDDVYAFRAAYMSDGPPTLCVWRDNIDFALKHAHTSIKDSFHRQVNHNTPASLTITMYLQDLEGDRSSQQVMNAFEPLLLGLPFRKLQSLDTTTFNDITLQYLEKLTSLQSLSIRGPAAADFLSSEHHRFRALRHLSIEGYREFWGCADNWKQLKDICQTYRSVCGEPLKSLRLHGFQRLRNISKDDEGVDTELEVQQMKEIIEKVIS